MIWQIKMLMILCFAVCTVCAIFFFLCEEYKLAYSIMLSGLLMIFLLYCAIHTLPGFSSDTVIINVEGVSIQSKNSGDSFFPWKEINAITHSRKFNIKILVCPKLQHKIFLSFYSRSGLSGGGWLLYYYRDNHAKVYRCVNNFNSSFANEKYTSKFLWRNFQSS